MTLALAACGLVLSGAAGSARFAPAKMNPARHVHPPKAWAGKVKFHYTIDFPTQEETDVIDTAKVVFRQVPRRPPGFYWIRSGKIEWSGSSQETFTGCQWTNSGSRAATKYDAFFDIAGRRPHYKAEWSSPDDLTIHVTYACPPPFSPYEADVSILHPFFPLARKTAGVRVNKALTLIAGSSHYSQTTSSGTESWDYKWNFHATR
jgi:hypothetical protein